MNNFLPSQFPHLVLAWFDQFGRKNLPWQINKTPYRIWISEIMLQQTQVKTVIPYYERFMERFPNIAALAHATEDEVLHAWAGLGYYSRARHLHRTAQIIQKNDAGEFPKTIAELTTLPGIGPSTAGAIMSIAFNQPAAILDGNVKRVLSRFHAIQVPLNNKEVEKNLWAYATHFLPKKRFGDYTQAMMDLGATICTRTNPQCCLCPLKKHCAAYHLNLTHLLPIKKMASSIPIKQATFLIIRAQQKIFLQKRPSSGIWGGLWSFPQLEGQPQADHIHAFCKTRFRTRIKHHQALTPFRHTFSHYHLDIFPVLVELLHIPLKLMEASTEIWYNPQHPQSLGLPKPIQLMLGELS